MRNLRLIWTVARHEGRMLLAGKTILVAMLGIAVAIGYAGLAGINRSHGWRTDYNEYQQLQAQQLSRFERRAEAILGQLASGQRGPVRIHRREFSWGPHVPDFPLAWVPPKAALPAAPLAAAAIGNTELFSAAYSVSASNREPSEVARQPGNPLQSALGHFDLAFVVVVLFPLFIITFTFDIFAAERDRGTLPLLLAQPVSNGVLMTGKLVARGTVGVLWPAIVVFAVLFWEVSNNPGAGTRLAFWMAAMMAYGIFWAGLAVAVNAGRRTAAVNAVILGSAWLLLAVLSPALMNGILQTVHPVPPRAQWVNVLRATEQDARLARETLTLKEQREALQRLLRDNPDMEQDAALYEGMALNRAVALEATIQAARDLAQVREAFEGPRRAQADLLSWLRFASPSVLTLGTLYDLAGAGSARYEDFLKQTREFQHDVERWAWDRRLRQAQMTPEQYASIPRFRFVEETVETVVRLTALPLVALWIMAVVMTLLAFRATHRLRPF